jgi:hypothetical protein
MDILIPIAVILAIIVFFVYASKSGAKLLKEREEKIARGEKGVAKIIEFDAAGISGTGTGGHYQGYKFTLEVSIDFKAPYRTKVVWEVYPMGTPKVQEGKEVDVKIDAVDPNIVYPNISGVQYSWTGMMIQGTEP